MSHKLLQDRNNNSTLEVIKEKHRGDGSPQQLSGTASESLLQPGKRKMPFNLKQLIDLQERIDAQAKSRVQAIMDARSKDYTKSQTYLSKKTVLEGTF